ncbi:MAG TPA: glycosyltransferase family 4 protein [Thermoleophilia bacterium]|nr:glycosyltransferase family 4 protein [Thermoleophilia bacterium]
MHILFLTHYFVPENNAPAARVHAMAREWSRLGHRVTVLTGVPNVPAGVVFEGYENRCRQVEWIDGIRTVRVWTYLAANRGRVRRGLNFLSYMVTAGLAGTGLRPRADVVIATTPQFFAGWAGVPVSRAHRAPFVLEVRDIWPDSITAVGALREGRIVQALGRLESALYASADHIVAVGDGYRQNMIAKGVPPAKIDIVTNGLDADLFTPRAADAELLRRLGLTGKFVITFAGTIGMASALGVVLDAARRLEELGRDDIAFLLIGDGAIRAGLEDQARARRLTNVVFTGLVPRPELPAYLASSDACLVHFRKEPLFGTILPSKFFEDAAMEKPILLGFEGAAREMLHEADCGLAFEPGNGVELAAAAVRLADDPVEARRLGANGRRYVLERFDRRRLARDYLEILERVCARRGGPR